MRSLLETLDYYFKGADMTPSIPHPKELPPVPAQTTAPFFPFKLEDLQYWVMKRKDGMVVKYRVAGVTGNSTAKVGDYIPSTGYTPTPINSSPSLSAWCKHNPSVDPIWVADKFDLYIADAPGCRGFKDEFDVVLDCGDILTASYAAGNEPVCSGDEELTKMFRKYENPPDYQKDRTRVLKLDWDDRAAPPMTFDFWPALYKQLNKIGGTVLTACQGGHGRSGTSLVCLLMVGNKDYTPADAIIHLRAMHCPRAIESGVQHSYIGEFGAFLGRTNDVERVKDVKDFKAEFLALKYESSKVYQDRLKKGGK